MKSLLAEQPLLVSILLGLFAVTLVYGWLQTGKKAAAILGLLTLLLIPLAWVVASYWVTDREAITEVIDQTADAVERNDHAAVLEVIGDSQTRQQAEVELPNYIFNFARVNKIRSIHLIEGTFPPEADVDMSVKVSVSDKRGRLGNLEGPRRLILRFQKIDDRWLVMDYRHLPIVGGPDGFSAVSQP